MPRHCEKFQLDRESDTHFFSGIDGSLFIPGMEEFHANDNYCVDYFYFHDELDPAVDEIKVRCTFPYSSRKIFFSNLFCRLKRSSASTMNKLRVFD